MTIAVAGLTKFAGRGRKKGSSKYEVGTSGHRLE
jgi:hypothetical protein